MKPQAGWGLRMAFKVDLGSNVAWERGLSPRLVSTSDAGS